MIGEIEVVPVVPRPEQWVFGAAPKAEPYWTLGDRLARLFLLFVDEREAHSFMLEAMNAREPRMKDYAQRTLQDLCLTPRASVVEVRGEPTLFAWMHEVANGGRAVLPPEIRAVEADVVLLPRRREREGRLAVVSETAFAERRVHCANPRPLTFGAPDGWVAQL